MDCHLVHQSYGVLSHAYLACPDRFWAGKTLDQVRDATLACCPLCRSRFLRREGDLLGEERRPWASLVALGHCLEEGAELLDDDAYGRVYFVRGISHHFASYRDNALADAGEALRLISLESPRGFFLDTIACVTVFVGGGDQDHETIALEHLKQFQDRIKGLDGWSDVRTRNVCLDGPLQVVPDGTHVGVKKPVANQPAREFPRVCQLVGFGTGTRRVDEGLDLLEVSRSRSRSRNVE